jgi:hypothetical protein
VDVVDTTAEQSPIVMRKFLTLREFYFLFHYLCEYIEPVKKYFRRKYLSVLGPAALLSADQKDSEEKLNLKKEVNELMEENECTICMEQQVDVVLNCSHGFCQKCISDWQREHQSCPVCRAQLLVEGVDRDLWVLTEKYLDIKSKTPPDQNEEGDEAFGVEKKEPDADDDYERKVLLYLFEYVGSKQNATPDVLQKNVAEQIASRWH